MNNKDIKIAFFDAKPYDKASFEKINKDFGFSISYFKPHLDPETAPLTAGYDAVCVFVNDVLNKEIVDILIQNKIKLIVLRCAGYNNVDLQAVYKNIHVMRVPAYSPFAVAEHALALMMSLNRKIHRAYYRTRDGNFNINGLMGFDMYGKTAGIIGTGRIGKVLITILKGLGMKILAYDPMPDKAYSQTENIQYVGLDEIYKNSDIISLHCPLTKETYHMINNDSIAKMKENIMIINTGRGQLIDTKALIEALKTHKIGAAGLDVYEEETDYFFEDFSNIIIDDDVLARLMTFPNVLITSHQAFFTEEALGNIASTTLNNVKSFYEGSRLENEICYKCGNNPPACKKITDGKCF